MFMVGFWLAWIGVLLLLALAAALRDLRRLGQCCSTAAAEEMREEGEDDQRPTKQHSRTLSLQVLNCLTESAERLPAEISRNHVWLRAVSSSKQGAIKRSLGT